MTHDSLMDQWRKSGPLVQSAIGAWLLLAVVLSIMVGIRSPARQSVYPAFITATRAWTHGADIYLPAGQGYRYAPVVAPALAPLSILPDRLGGVLWRWANGLILVGGLWAACRASVPFVWRAPTIALLFILILPDAIANLNNGQPNAMIAGLMLWSIASVLRQRWMFAAICLSAATLLKVYPIALAGVLVVLYPRQLGWRLALCITIGLLLPFALQRADYVRHQYELWYRYVWQENRQVANIQNWYRDVRLPLKVWFGVEIGNPAYRLIEAVTGVVLAGVCWMLKRRKVDEPMLLGLALAWTTWWMTLLGPATETVTYLILAPALAWGLIATWGRLNSSCEDADGSNHATVEHHRANAFEGNIAPSIARWIVTLAYVILISVHVSGWFGGRSYLTLGPNPLAAMLMGVYLLVITAQLFRPNPSAAPIAPTPARPNP